jgi:hypothetical protein
MNLKIIIVFIMLPFVFLLSIHPAGFCASSAAMMVLSEAELSSVYAGAGIDIDIKGSGVRLTMDSYYFSDTTDHNPATPEIDYNLFEFNNIVVDDGAGGYFQINTPEGKPITIDIGTDAYGDTIEQLDFLWQYEQMYLAIGNLRFCDQDLGSLYIDNFSQTDTAVNIGAHGGVDFDYASRIDMDGIRYVYNTVPQSLVESGIHLAGSATGDPATPGDWAFIGPFKIGDIYNNPATIDVDTSVSTGKTSVFFNLPMQGCYRVDNVALGGVDFGPIAIDGITVHRLQIQLLPGS